MSVAAKTQPTAGPRWGPEMVVMCVLVGAALVALYFRWLYAQHLNSWTYPGDWGHACVVPLISGYLIWQRREELAAARVRPFWPALAPLLLTVVAYLFFVATRFRGGHMIQGWALVTTLASVSLLLLGPGAFRPLFLPIAFLVCGITISQEVMIRLTAPLQLIASQGAFVILNIVGAVAGFSADIKGTVLTLVGASGKPETLNVAEACAGMRMVIAFFALAGAMALLGSREWWQRIALVLLAAPVAILVNVGRVAVIGGLTLVDPHLAGAGAHDLIGQLLLIPGLGLFLLMLWILNRIIRPEARPAGRPA